jgi:molybdenum cofactor biosynthesis enzyme MoaA
MTTANLQISLNFNQILEIVQQLSDQEKLKLNQVLTKDLINKKLTGFLEDFKTDELSLELINQEVETVRSEIYAQNSNA